MPEGKAPGQLALTRGLCLHCPQGTRGGLVLHVALAERDVVELLGDADFPFSRGQGDGAVAVGMDAADVRRDGVAHVALAVEGVEVDAVRGVDHVVVAGGLGVGDDLVGAFLLLELGAGRHLGTEDDALAMVDGFDAGGIEFFGFLGGFAGFGSHICFLSSGLCVGVELASYLFIYQNSNVSN